MNRDRIALPEVERSPAKRTDLVHTFIPGANCKARTSTAESSEEPKTEQESYS